MATGNKSLEDDTKDLKTHFLTYLNSCLRLNGTDAPKEWNRTSWIATNGVFDLANMPQTSKYAIEFKDKVYVAGRSDSPDRVDISGIADSVTRTVSWTVGNTYIVFEQEDGGGGITGLWKVPGYVIVGKKRTLKRWDGATAYPEDMINQGVPSQEAGIVAQGTLFWANENGAWASTGGDPKKISTYSVDKIIKSCSAANLANVAAGTDEEHIYFSFASVTISGETHANVVLKFNILQNTWDILKYNTLHRAYAKYVDSADAVFLLAGDDDGNVLKLNTGTDDNGTPIYYSMETHDWVFGYRARIKGISRFAVITENISDASLMWRSTHNAEDWNHLATIQSEVEDVHDIDIRAVRYNFKVIGKTTTGQCKIVAFDFEEGIRVFDNTSI